MQLFCNITRLHNNDSFFKYILFEISYAKIILKITLNTLK